MDEIKIKNIKVEYAYDYRDVKYIRYYLEEDKLFVVIPNSYNGTVKDCILEKEQWIYRNIIQYRYPIYKLFDEDYPAKPIKINDKQLYFGVEYKKVKYVKYKMYQGRLELIIPLHNNTTIEEHINNKKRWIYKKIIQYENYEEKYEKRTKDKQLITRTTTEFKQICNNYFEKYQKQLNVKANRIQYRQMTRKWGSCSSKRNITISKHLQYMPEKLTAYIIYHELAHIIVMAHNDEFFKIIKKEFPNYKKLDQELEDYHYLMTKNNQ